MTHDERRAAILSAAVRLFAERGFRGTTTRALAEAIGVTEPVLYEHFKSKRDLFCAIVDAKSQEGIARGAALLEPYAVARNDRGLFVALGELILNCIYADEGYIRLHLSAALEDPELGQIFYERQRPAREKLADYIALRIAEGAFRPVDARVAARAFYGMLHNHATSTMLYRDDFVRLEPRQVIEGMVDIFLTGITNDRCKG